MRREVPCRSTIARRPPSLFVRRSQFALVADVASEQVASCDTDSLYEVHSVKLWHIGKQMADGVKCGLDDETFRHPACDIGGLTSVLQKVGESIEFVNVPPTAWPSGGGTSVEVATALHTQWCKLAGKQLNLSLVLDLEKWLSSVKAGAPNCALPLASSPPPPSPRMLPSPTRPSPLRLCLFTEPRARPPHAAQRSAR